MMASRIKGQKRPMEFPRHPERAAPTRPPLPPLVRHVACVLLALFSWHASAADLAESDDRPDRSQKVEQEDTTAQIAVRYSVLFGAPLVTLGYGMKAWDWGSKGSWRWGRESWFGRDTDHGGIDKLAHAFGCYLITRGTNAAFFYSEGDRWTRWFYGPLLGFIVGTGIEIGDAYTAKHGFSWEDILADYIGVAVGVLLDAFPVADAFIGFSTEYWPTAGFAQAGDNMPLHISNDTGGFRYMMNLKLAGFERVGVEIPDFLTYVTVDVGYYAKGFTDCEAAVGDTRRKRFWFVGVSLNVADVIRAFYENPDVWHARLVSTPFEYYHLPLGPRYDMSID